MRMTQITLTAEQYRVFRKRLGEPAIPLLYAFYEVFTDDEGLAAYHGRTSSVREHRVGGNAHA